LGEAQRNDNYVGRSASNCFNFAASQRSYCSRSAQAFGIDESSLGRKAQSRRRCHGGSGQIVEEKARAYRSGTAQAFRIDESPLGSPAESSG
jgi:hypothetical protein